MDRRNSSLSRLLLQRRSKKCEEKKFKLTAIHKNNKRVTSTKLADP